MSIKWSLGDTQRVKTSIWVIKQKGDVWGRMRDSKYQERLDAAPLCFSPQPSPFSADWLSLLKYSCSRRLLPQPGQHDSTAGLMFQSQFPWASDRSSLAQKSIPEPVSCGCRMGSHGTHWMLSPSPKQGLLGDGHPGGVYTHSSVWSRTNWQHLQHRAAS